MAFIRSISGLRATLGEHLTPTVVCNYVAAFAQITPSGAIVVGRDGRPSGAWIELLVTATLNACGRDVILLGVATTPTVQLITEHSAAVGGISITASHNPAEWNGLKFIDSTGVFLDAAANAQLWSVADSKEFSFTTQQQGGHIHPNQVAAEEHIQRVLELDAVQGAPMASGQIVVVDAVNCSGSVIVPELLRRLGYTPFLLFADGSGVFPHAPEPLAENLGQLGNAVREQSAAFGIAVDPDADRLVLYDEGGNPIGEERTIALAAKALLDSGERGTIVVNYSTTRLVDDVAAEYSCSVVRSAVGEINVVERMRSVNAVLGGEGSGGVILQQCHAGRDSIVGIALITAYLRKHAVTLRDAVALLPKYEMIKTKIALPSGAAAENILNSVATAFPDATVQREDGVHLSWSNKWAHIRVSNTEPIMRIIAEAPTEEQARTLVETIQHHIHE